MPILNGVGVERFKGLEFSGIEDIMYNANFFSIFIAETELSDEGFQDGLPYYVAMQYHLGGKPQKEIARELDLNQGDVSRVMRYWNIPRMTVAERNQHFRD